METWRRQWAAALQLKTGISECKLPFADDHAFNQVASTATRLQRLYAQMSVHQTKDLTCLAPLAGRPSSCDSAYMFQQLYFMQMRSLRANITGAPLGGARPHAQMMQR